MPKDGPVYHFAFTYSLPIACRDEPGIAAFTARQPDLHAVLGRYFDDAYYQHECTEGNNHHYQGYAHAGSKQRVGRVGRRVSAALGHQVHFQVASTAGVEALKDYTMKADTRVAGPWGLKARPAKPRTPRVVDTLYPWQRDVADLITTVPDERTIHWICEPTGCTGKTAMARWLYKKYGIPVFNYARASDILNVVAKMPGKPAYVFDFTRSRPKDSSWDDVYAAIESVKNGIFVNTKYETAMVFMDFPHVICFANQPPDLAKLSRDRWVIWCIQGAAPDAELIPYVFKPKT